MTLTTTVTTTERRDVAPSTRSIAAFLGLWSTTFAVVHMAWALNWRWGLPEGAAPIAERPWFLAYDVVAGLLMFASAAVCVAFWRGRDTKLWRRATLAGSVLALLRGVPALYFDVTTDTYGMVSFGADVWFTIAGLAGLAMLRSSRERRRDPA